MGGRLGQGGRGTERFVGAARGPIGGGYIVLGGLLRLVDGGLGGVRLLALDRSCGAGGDAIIRTGLLGLAAAHLASCLSARERLCSLEDRLLQVEELGKGKKRNEGVGSLAGEFQIKL